MDAHLNDIELARYAQYLADDNINAVSSRVIDHIKYCDSCAAQAVELSFILERIEIDLQTDNPKKTGRTLTVVSWISGIAAGLAILLGAYFYADYAAQKPTYGLKKTLPDKSLPMIAKEEYQPEGQNDKPMFGNVQTKPDFTQLAVYQPHSDSEKLVAYFNSGHVRGDDIEVKTPSTLSTTSGKVVALAWSGSYTGMLTLELFNNRAESIMVFTVSKNTHKLTDLAAGLYYWKLYNEDFDLLFCGKIIVKK